MLNTFENNMKRNGDFLLVWYQKTCNKQALHTMCYIVSNN